MTLRELAALSLFALPFVGLAALWFWWVRGVPQKHHDDAARREAALALPAESSISINMGRGSLEDLVFTRAPMLVVAVVGLSLPFLLLFRYVPSGMELLGLGLLVWCVTCGGLWKYARTNNRQPALYLSGEGMQALTGTRLMWRDVEKVEGRQDAYGFGVYRAVRHTLTLTLRPGVEPRVLRDGGLLLWGMLYLGKPQDGRAALTLNVTNLEDWATVGVLVKLMEKRIDAQRARCGLPHGGLAQT